MLGIVSQQHALGSESLGWWFSHIFHQTENAFYLQPKQNITTHSSKSQNLRKKKNKTEKQKKKPKFHLLELDFGEKTP